MRGNTSETVVPTTTRHRYRRSGEGWEGIEETVPCARLATKLHCETLLAMDEAKAIVGDIRKREGIKSWAGASDSTVRVAASRAEHLLCDALFASCRDDTWRIDDERWPKITTSFLALVDRGMVTTNVSVFLSGVISPATIQFSMGQLANPTAPDLDLLYEALQFSAPAAANYFSNLSVFRICHKRHINDNLTSLQARILDVVRLLRIWTAKPVAILYIAYDSRPLGMISGNYSFPPYHVLIGIPHSIDNADELVGFSQRCETVVTQPPQGLDVALRRFDIMQDTPRASDRILDQMILLEALFQGGCERPMV